MKEKGPRIRIAGAVNSDINSEQVNLKGKQRTMLAAWLHGCRDTRADSTGRATKKHCIAMDFSRKICAVRVLRQTSRVAWLGCLGIANDNWFAWPGSMPGQASRLVCRRL